MGYDYRRGSTLDPEHTAYVSPTGGIVPLVINYGRAGARTERLVSTRIATQNFFELLGGNITDNPDSPNTLEQTVAETIPATTPATASSQIAPESEHTEPQQSYSNPLGLYLGATANGSRRTMPHRFVDSAFVKYHSGH